MKDKQLLNKIIDLITELDNEDEMIDEMVILFFDPGDALESLKDDYKYWVDEYIKSENKDVRDAIIQLIVALNKSFYAALNKYYINLN